MIAYLKGKFVNKTPSSVIVDVGGIGYDVNISLNTYEAIQPLAEGILFTHLLVREDAQLLYGFATGKEKEFFLLLMSVSGIGANTARIMLSYMKPDELATAIMHGDSKALERIKGIGKKTAERAVLELRDKIGKSASIEVPNLPAQAAPSARQDALDALLALGIQRAQAEQAVLKVLKTEPDLPLEELLKKALKQL
ncbi:MAG: Holliday junction branch migration protein RuvA [Niabella sp.]